jgi:ABC-type dipeptide/oligopeptide/nickel transport system permease subunit
MARAMLAEAQPYMQREPLLLLAPGLLIFITALSVTMAGQGLSIMLDPRQRSAGRKRRGADAASI